MTPSPKGSARQFLALTTYDRFRALRTRFYLIKGALFYRFVFKSFGSGSVLYRPMLLVRPNCVEIGLNTTIREGVRIQVIGDGVLGAPLITIGDNVNIEQSVHIVCRNRITIGSNVSITAFCSIVDVSHPVDGLTSNVKIGDRIQSGNDSVEICDGAFLGIGARIHPGVRIGRGAVIGANAVVTHDVPDYHIAAGIPATVRRARRLADDAMSDDVGAVPQ